MQVVLCASNAIVQLLVVCFIWKVESHTVKQVGVLPLDHSLIVYCIPVILRLKIGTINDSKSLLLARSVSFISLILVLF